jgi:hypothetical protein
MPADSVLAKAPYKIPTVVDTDRICISVSCPNDGDHISNFLEALATLGLWSNYRLEADRQAKPVADVWMEIFRETESSLCDCALRNGPNGLQQFDKTLGAWIDIQGNSAQGDPRTTGTVPAPWTTPPAGQSGNCLAAANIVDIFRNMQEDAGAKLGTLAGFAIMLVEFETFLALALPLIGEVIELATSMAAAALEAGSVAFGSAFDPVTHADAYTEFECIISCYAASDGRVTAGAINSIKTVFLPKLPILFSNPVEAALWNLFVTDFLDSQGPNGLTKMAKMSNITSADCSGCTDCEWCIHYDFRISDYGFTTISTLGAWHAGIGWVGVDNAPFKSLRITKNVSGHATHMQITQSVDNQFGPGSDALRLRLSGSTVESLDTGHGDGDTYPMTTFSSGTFSEDFDAILTGSDARIAGSYIIQSITIFGTGTAPSTEPACV